MLLGKTPTINTSPALQNAMTRNSSFIQSNLAFARNDFRKQPQFCGWLDRNFPDKGMSGKELAEWAQENAARMPEEDLDEWVKKNFPGTEDNKD